MPNNGEMKSKGLHPHFCIDVLDKIDRLPYKEQRELFSQLREDYADNPIALQQLDVYDPDSIYHEKFKELKAAVEAGDKAAVNELDAWYSAHYPDLADSN